MAGETKGDNKFFQIIMVVITTIVAPVSVYFITHSVPVPSSPTATAQSTSAQVSQVGGASITLTADGAAFTPTLPLAEATSTVTTTATATVPAATETVLAPTATLPAATATTPPTATATAQPTLAGVQNPKGFLPAGEPGIVNGMSVEVVSADIEMKDGIASIQVRVSNLTGKNQTFQYDVEAIAVKEANGHNMEVVYGEKRGACDKKDLETIKKIELAPGQEIVLQSVEAGKESEWCASKDGLLLPLYKASSKEARKSILIEFNGFGPFKGFGFEIKF